ncbi:hypothetical protein TNCV_722411 [Trichonephila clavipes]|nr:hypothetical protein TNCV_722411 [Trichonephila clavipes]
MGAIGNRSHNIEHCQVTKTKAKLGTPPKTKHHAHRRTFSLTDLTCISILNKAPLFQKSGDITGLQMHK